MFAVLTVVVAVLALIFGATLIKVMRNSTYTYLSPAAYDEKMKQLTDARAEKIEAATTQAQIDEVETLYNIAVKGYKIRREHG